VRGGPRGESLGALSFFGEVLRKGIAHAKVAKPRQEPRRRSGRVRGGRGISKFEMRKLEIGECEGENVGMWCWGR
jgi:hypothetical protein